MTTAQQPPFPEKDPKQSSFRGERLRQARLSFNLAFFVVAGTALVSVVGATLIFAGRVPEGVATTTGGLTTGGLCLKLTKDANDRLDKIIAELDTDNEDQTKGSE